MTEANHVLVGIADVYFADPPRFVRRTVNHVGAESRNPIEVIVHIIHENGEPGPRVTLCEKAKEDFDLAETDRTE